MKKWIAGSVLSLACAAGCASDGEMRQSTGTAVSLTGNNYTMIHAGATGESTGFRLLMFLPIVSPSYGDAKKDLYRSVGEPLEGRAIALANYTEDRSTMYLLLFSLPKLSVTADVVEFTDVSSAPPPRPTR